MKFGLLLIMLVFASKNHESKVESAKSEKTFQEHNAENLILVKIEEDDCTRANKKSSRYFGVRYNESYKTWAVRRWSKSEVKPVYNGHYKDEETAAHASDTLARKLMKKGEQNHKLNFPYDHTEVFPEKTKTTKYIGVYYRESKEKWSVHRWSKEENKTVSNGSYKDEKTAAHASDTLARKLMENDKQNFKLNFPDDHTEVLPEKNQTSKFIGVSYCKSRERYRVHRWSKTENKTASNGHYKDEETAAHASDTLARKLMEKGEQNHKLNFPYDHTEVLPEKNQTSKYIGVSYCKSKERWNTPRWSKRENKQVYNGHYKDEEAAAHASDALARKLIANGEQNHKLNFPYDRTEVLPEKNQRNKRKRSEQEDMDSQSK